MLNHICNPYNIIQRAANAPKENEKIFDIDMFKALMPQFFKKEIITTKNGREYDDFECLVPEEAVNEFIQMANDNILECRWFGKWKYACALYVAHYSTLYLQTYAPDSESIDELKDAGSMNGLMSSATLGDASISYDNSLVQKMDQWGVWGLTIYGQQLIQEAKLLGKGSTFYI